MINRKEWTKRHDPVLTCIDAKSPLTVGNGDFAFTADITGLQTLYMEYAPETPLCTQSNYGWHTIPANTPSGKYTLDDVRMNTYDFCGREVTYAKTKFPGNEHVYDWLRQNPHKVNLMRISLRLNGEEIPASGFSDIHQRLHLYEGLLESRWTLAGASSRVHTACAPDKNVLAFEIASPLLENGLTVDIDFPYGAADITASDWNSPAKHTTRLDGRVISRAMDDFTYTVSLGTDDSAVIEQISAHTIRIRTEKPILRLTAGFDCAEKNAAKVFESAAGWWKNFWEKGAAVDFSGADDARANELERRIILSLYLLAVNSSGSVPPAETGLICNSWYGKAHLEMHFWHMAWAPLWGHADLLDRCLKWYHDHLPEARMNASRNGYKGARWPKMIAHDGIDSPSPIAVLLVWQQPHIIAMLELMRRSMPKAEAENFLHRHWPLIRETADFMADYAVKDENGLYHIEPPVIPVQERYSPEVTRDPSFEIAYWQFGLDLAVKWAKDMGLCPDEKWTDVSENAAPPPVHNGLYTAHLNRPDTFETMAQDHPSMLQCLGMLPGENIDKAAMERTLNTVLEVWNENSLWGWDFAVMAMTAAGLGKPALAVDLLLKETNKNTYVANGNNRQETRRDLPLYLPGNGSLLLAAAMMAQKGGFPEKGWFIRSEGLHPYF